VLVYATNLDCLELYVVEEVFDRTPPQQRPVSSVGRGRNSSTSTRKSAGSGDGAIPRQRLAFADAANCNAAVANGGIDSDGQTTGSSASGHDAQMAARSGGGDDDAFDAEGSAYWAPDTMSLVDFIQVR
jgi:hypothetical protein